MIRGLLYSENGLVGRAQQLEMVANNLANSSTTGYKKDVVFSKTISEVSNQSVVDPPSMTYVDFSQGAVTQTNNKTDIAIQGNAFFSVQTKEGIKYTRNGSFQVDPEGYLCTRNGDQVLGEMGPVQIAGDFIVGADGSISEDGVVANRLKLTKFDDPNALQKQGDGYFITNDREEVGRPAEDFKVLQGFVEDSNVNALDEMVNLIEIYRFFEADQRAVRAQDETLNKAVNDVGRVAG